MFVQQHTTPRPARWAILSAAALALGAGVTFAQPAPPEAPPQAPQPPAAAPARPAAVPLSGTVTSYNFGPRGNTESVMLKAGDKVVQLNYPPDAAGIVAKLAAIGANVQVTAAPALGMPDHAVYELVAITPAGGQPLTIAGPDARHAQHVDSTVKSLNYGRRGEVNGVVLETGDLVHFGPAAASIVNPTVGQKLSVDGQASPSIDGHNLIDADSVNGTPIPRPAPPPAGREDKGPGPRDPRAPRPDDAPPPPPPRHQNRGFAR